MRSCIVSQAISTNIEGGNNKAQWADIKHDTIVKGFNDDEGNAMRITGVDEVADLDVVKVTVAVATQLWPRRCRLRYIRRNTNILFHISLDPPATWHTSSHVTCLVCACFQTNLGKYIRLVF